MLASSSWSSSSSSSTIRVGGSKDVSVKAARRRLRLLRFWSVLWLWCAATAPGPLWLQVQAAVDQVFDGVEIKDQDYLWFTAIRRATGFRFVCSGALVGPRYVLTARHCVDELSLSDIRVQVGYLCEDPTNCGRPDVTISVSKWDEHRNGGDVALLTLERNVPFEVAFAVPFLGQAKQGTLSTGRSLQLVGAGRVGELRQVSFRVEEISVKVLSEQKCLKRISNRDLVTEYVVCTIAEKGNPCQGDSGAALVVPGRKLLKKRDVIMAVHNFGPENCSQDNAKGRPLGHFRVEEATKMIQRIICQGPFPADWCDLKKNKNKNKNKNDDNVPLGGNFPTSAPKNTNGGGNAKPVPILFQESVVYSSSYLQPDTNTSVSITNKGKSVTIDRNAWFAFLLDTAQDVDGDYVLQFDFTVHTPARQHFVCLDVDAIYFRSSSVNPELCFRLAGTDSFFNSWTRYGIYPAPLQGQTVSYTIPLSQYMGDTTRFTRYIAFVNYNKSPVGRSTYSNVYLYKDANLAGREFTVQVKNRAVSAKPVRYAGTYDQAGTIPRLIIPNNGRSLTINGNAWNAIPIGLYEITKDTVLEFDFRVVELGTRHFICLDVNLAYVYRSGTTNPDLCFRVAGTEAFNFFWTRYGLWPEPFAGQELNYVVPLYQHLESLGRTIRYITLVTSSIADVGEVTFSNVKLRELPGTYAADFSFEVFGQSLTAVTPERYGGANDFAGVGERLSTSRKGQALTMVGNSWTAFSMGLLSLTPQTVLEFDFMLNEPSLKHFVCLDIDLIFSYSRSVPSSETCFLLAGTDPYLTDFTRYAIYPTPLVSQQATYSIPLSHFIGDSPKSVRYVTFVTSGVADVGAVTFSNVKLYNDETLSSPLTVEVMGSELAIAPTRYGGTFDGYGTTPRFQVSNDQKEVTLFGNSWNAYEVGLVELTVDTVLEFDFVATFLGTRHFVCLDIDLTYAYRRSTPNPEMCFHLAGTAAFDDDWTKFNIVPNPIVAQKVSYEIPLAHFASGIPQFIRYLVLITSSTAGDQGQATFSNLRLGNGRRHRGGLIMDIMGVQPAPLPLPLRYGGTFDHVGPSPKFSVSSDSQELTLHGNSWNAYPIGLTQLTLDTVLQFDFVVNFGFGSLHFVCLDLDMAYSYSRSVPNADLCFRLAGTSDYSNGWTRHAVYPAPLLSQKVSYAIPLGQYIENIQGRNVRFLSFVSSTTDTLVRATFSNVKLIQSAPSNHFGELTVSVMGSDETSRPVRYAGSFDFYGTWPRFETTNQGRSLTLFGNVWNAYPVDMSTTVTAKTVLEFDFTVDFLSDRHMICIDQDATYSYRRSTSSEWCFHIAGSAAWDDDFTRFGPLTPAPLLSQKVTYRLVLGDFIDFSTESVQIKYLVFATRGPAEVGQVTFANVKISEGG